MLYKNENGTIVPMQERKCGTRLSANEFLAVCNLLQDIISQKRYDRNGKPFMALDLVGRKQIDWERNEALRNILVRYPNSQKGQSSTLGRILFDVLYHSPIDYIYDKPRNGHAAKYCKR